MLFAYPLLFFCLCFLKQTLSEMLREKKLTSNYLTMYILWDGAFHYVSVMKKKSLMACVAIVIFTTLNGVFIKNLNDLHPVCSESKRFFSPLRARKIFIPRYRYYTLSVMGFSFVFDLRPPRYFIAELE